MAQRPHDRNLIVREAKDIAHLSMSRGKLEFQTVVEGTLRTWDPNVRDSVFAWVQGIVQPAIDLYRTHAEYVISNTFIVEPSSHTRSYDPIHFVTYPNVGRSL
jgi:hypothetical protein